MDIQKYILKHGIDNCIFLLDFQPLHKILGISFTSSSDKSIYMCGKIDEKRYKIKDNYKITIKPIHNGFANRDFYMSDLKYLIKHNIVKMYFKSSQYE